MAQRLALPVPRLSGALMAMKIKKPLRRPLDNRCERR
jgi:hypothetical protein